MGAASSISSNNIYISKDLSSNKYVTMLFDRLQTLDNNIIFTEKNNINENLIYQSAYILIYVSPTTIRSAQQVTEISHAWDSKKPIIYIMIYKDYTPLSNPELNSIIKNDRWISCFDEKSVDNSFAQISYLLAKN